jgi:hypothetical protein
LQPADGDPKKPVSSVECIDRLANAVPERPTHDHDGGKDAMVHDVLVDLGPPVGQAASLSRDLIDTGSAGAP